MRSDDFPTLRPITTRPVALNLAAWDLQSEDAMSNDDHTCTVCGRPHATKGFWRFFGAFRVRNVRFEIEDFLCRYCRSWAASHPAHWIPYRGYWIEYDSPPIPTWQQHAWQWWHRDYDGAPDAHDGRHGSAASLEDAKREIDEQIAESSDVEVLSCYLCRITNDDFPDDYFRAAGLPQSDLHVCSRCDGSWQHQTDKREAWLVEESGV